MSIWNRALRADDDTTWREACEREAQVARARARPRNTALMLSPRESGFTPRLAAQQQSNGFAPSTTYQQLCSLTPKPPPISTLIRPTEYELVTTFHRQKFHLDWDESKVDHQVFPVDPAVARRRQIQQLRAQVASERKARKAAELQLKLHATHEGLKQKHLARINAEPISQQRPTARRSLPSAAWG